MCQALYDTSTPPVSSSPAAAAQNDDDMNETMRLNNAGPEADVESQSLHATTDDRHDDENGVVQLDVPDESIASR